MDICILYNVFLFEILSSCGIMFTLAMSRAFSRKTQFGSLLTKLCF